jgi:hypothetical protein
MRKAGHTAGDKYVLPYETSVEPGDVLVSAMLKKLHSENDSDYDTFFELYTSSGGTVLTYCVDCGTVLTANYSYGDAKHSRVKTETVDATCTKEGVTKTVCRECGKTVSATIIPYADHTDGAVTLRNVSCTTQGMRYTACSVCGENIRSEFVAEIDHTYGSGELDPAPTLRRPGKMVYACIYCGATKTETVPCPEYGDADGDGDVTAADARIAIRAAVGLEDLSEIALVAADINHSGAIESDDARYILRMSVGLDEAYDLMNKYY